MKTRKILVKLGLELEPDKLIDVKIEFKDGKNRTIKDVTSWEYDGCIDAYVIFANGYKETYVDRSCVKMIGNAEFMCN